MTKEKSVELVHQYVHVFSCPLCNSPMKVSNLKSLICLRNHTFDFAKQGYVNMMNRSTNSHYDKELFKARQKIIMESNLFTFLHQKISEIIIKNIDALKGEIMIFDAGCGEGSHLQRILNKCEHVTMRGIGLDISKEGIRMAASHYKESIWLVGDIANLPLADQSCHVTLNILSPANYKEFKRVLVPDGLVIKVVPRSNYLKELRELLFDDTDKTFYNNEEIVSLFNRHFHQVDVLNLSDTMAITQKELINLIHMSPLTWNTSQKDIERMINQDISEVTVDLDVLVAIHKLA